MTESDDDGPSRAELFERFFGPSIFTPWTDVLLEYASPGPGDHVLDLACATGIVARRVAPMVGDAGGVVGLDVSPEMLEVARERAGTEGVAIEWRVGDATELDLPDGAFDLVFCQQGIQFFPDPGAALREARRVLGDDGRLVLNVWQPLERHPVYRALLEAEARHLGADITEVGKPFLFGEDTRLRTLLDEAGFAEVQVDERTLEVEFPEPETFVTLTLLAGAAVVPELAPDDPEERTALVEAVTKSTEGVLREHRDGDRLRFPMPNYLAVARG